MEKQMMVLPTYEEMSEAAAGQIYKVLSDNPAAAIVIATGHSPLLAYRLLVKKILETGLDISRVTWIKLDEWIGVPGTDESTCEVFIRRELLEPLQIKEDRYIHFNPEAEDPQKEAERIEACMRELPRLDLAILGIGMNGHLGLNEPGEQLEAYAHTMTLDPKTKTHEMLRHTHRSVQQGITLGMKDLFRADQILLLADGDEKETGMEYFLNDIVTTKVPVSFLKLHPNCVCIVNQSSFQGLL